MNKQEEEAERFRRLPAARLREWERLRKLGMVRISVAEYLCEKGKWHRVESSSRHNVATDQGTAEALTVIAARQARMTKCPCVTVSK